MDILLPLLLFLWARDRDRDRDRAPGYPVPGPQGYPIPQWWGGAWYGPWTQTYPQPQPSGGSGQQPPTPQVTPTWPWPGQQPPPPQQQQPPPPIGVWGQGGGGIAIGPVPPWPGPGSGVPTGPARPWRRIRSGDTGYGLAQRATGVGGRWRELLEVNPELSTYTDAKKQTQIKPWQVGQKIYLPPGWEKIADGIEPGAPLPVPPGAISEARR